MLLVGPDNRAGTVVDIVATWVMGNLKSDSVAELENSVGFVASRLVVGLVQRKVVAP